MQTIPLSALPQQIVSVQLNNQVCQIKVYQLATGMFLDLYVDNTLVIGGVICQANNPIVRQAYLGFNGDLVFVDTAGNSDPDYSGLGSRWLLAYLDAGEVTALVAAEQAA